jgi:hypothetical protein
METNMDNIDQLGGDSVNRVGVSTIPFAPRYPLLPVQDLVNLGPIAHLAGHWSGTGFNIIWRPDNTGDPGFKVRRFLQLNQTLETLKFDTIASAVPSRGLFKQSDINIYGLNYLQKVKDNDVDLPGFPNFPNAGEDLHIEPGLFLNVPASGGVEDPNDLTGNVTDPVIPASIVRLATIPHGVSVLLQGKAPGATPVPGTPTFPPVYPIEAITKAYKDYPDYDPVVGADFAAQYQAFPQTAGLGVGIQPANVPTLAAEPATPAPPTFHGVPENMIANDIPYPNAKNAQSNGPFPAAWQAYLDDPNVLLRNAIEDQHILGYIEIKLATPSQAAIGQIPFLGIADPALEPNSNVGTRASRSNAFVHSVTSTFWIEWVRVRRYPGFRPLELREPELMPLNPFPGEPTVLQLQYTQTVILNFNNVLWPHVSVATLRQHF